MKLDKWINKPNNIKITDDVEFDVLPKTDFWQVTHYGFSRTDGNCFVTEVKDDVCFTVANNLSYKDEFDQQGIIVYIDENNFAKLCIENQLNKSDKLGSVVCKDKRSDWATQDVDNVQRIYYRVSKRGLNYLFECSLDGATYKQVRLFDLPASQTAFIGVFGASPLGDGFKAKFTDINFSNNSWVLDLNDIPENLK